jgi:hypothetical protein
MVTHTSATKREETPHVNNSNKNTITNALRRRAQSVIKDTSIDSESRALVRYALEINDPMLAELVRRADAGESITTLDEGAEAHEISGGDLDEDKIEALTEILCRSGDEPETKSAALLVLMATLENAAHPKAIANTAKHLAFTRCGELNVNGMVDAQVAMLECKLLEHNVIAS